MSAHALSSCQEMEEVGDLYELFGVRNYLKDCKTTFRNATSWSLTRHLDALSRCPNTRVLSFANRPRLRVTHRLTDNYQHDEQSVKVSILADYLRTSSVTHLDLSNMLLDGDALGEILGAALPNQSDDVWDGIKVLILSGNERGGSGGKDLPAVLEANAWTMLHLDVGGLPDDQVAQAIDYPFSRGPSTLDISGTQVNMFGISLG